MTLFSRLTTLVVVSAFIVSTPILPDQAEQSKPLASMTDYDIQDIKKGYPHLLNLVKKDDASTIEERAFADVQLCAAIKKYLFHVPDISYRRPSRR